MDGSQSRSENEEPAHDDAQAPDPESVAELLDEIPGAYERAQHGLRQAEAGESIALDEFDEL